MQDENENSMLIPEEVAAPVSAPTSPMSVEDAEKGLLVPENEAATSNIPINDEEEGLLNTEKKIVTFDKEEKSFPSPLQEESPFKSDDEEGRLVFTEQAFAVAISKSGTLEKIHLDVALSRLSNSAEDDDPVWIDIQLDVKDLPLLTANILAHLPQLSPFLRRHLSNTNQFHTPQVLPLKEEAFLVMRIIGIDQRDTRHAAALCLKSLLLTVTSSTHDEVRERKHAGDDSLRRCDSLKVNIGQGEMQGELPEASVSGAVVLWFNFHLRRSALKTIEVRKTVYDLVNKSQEIKKAKRIKTIKRSHIHEVKDELLRLTSVSEEQWECVQNLEGGDAMSDGLDFTSPVLKGALSVILSTASSTERSLIRLEKRIDDLEAKYDAKQQDIINQRLNILTILSAVMLPLTLLTGFWGMNWEHGMPAIRTRYGYWYALSAMIMIAFTLLVWFYRNGWMTPG
jgi:hypothetical protein